MLISTLVTISLVSMYLLCFFYLYVLVMGIYRVHLAGKLKGALLILCAPVVVLGLIVDVFANLFIATFIFRELPREFLVTTRLTRLKVDPLANWHNKYIAQFVCENLLDVFDPNGDHC